MVDEVAKPLENSEPAEPAVTHDSPPPVSRREVWANRFRYFMLGVAIVCIAGVGYLVLTKGVSTPQETVIVPTLTPTFTPSITSTPTATSTPRPPTTTPTPGPTLTPLPPVRYRVKAGDTWLGIAIWYDIGLNSLLYLNDRSEDDYLKADEEILIPWPTYTPTPEATLIPTLHIVEEMGPEQCREHTIAAGETLLGIALSYDVSVQSIRSVNNITDPDLVKEGQKLCIPLVTPGPAPSPTPAQLPTPDDEPLLPAPQLLYPPADTEIMPGTHQATIQWAVVGLLDPDEYYMVEIRNLGRPDSRPIRGFVQDTTWRLPEAVRPEVGSIEVYSWRVGVVRASGEPSSEEFRWERIGLPSGWQTFLWMGVAPDETPAPTPLG